MEEEARDQKLRIKCQLNESSSRARGGPLVWFLNWNVNSPPPVETGVELTLFGSGSFVLMRR